MTKSELTVTTRLTLQEIIQQCKQALIEKGLLETVNNETELRYNKGQLNFNTFEIIIATGLYHIINNNEVKTNFNYLGNNNDVKLFYNRIGYEKIINKEEYGLFSVWVIKTSMIGSKNIIDG